MGLISSHHTRKNVCFTCLCKQPHGSTRVWSWGRDGEGAEGTSGKKAAEQRLDELFYQQIT